MDIPVSRNKIAAVSILELEIQFLRRVFRNSKWMHRSLKQEYFFFIIRIFYEKANKIEESN